MQVEAGDSERGLDRVGGEEVANPESQYVRSERVQTGRTRLNTNNRERFTTTDPDTSEVVENAVGVPTPAVCEYAARVATEHCVDRPTCLSCLRPARVQVDDQPGGRITEGCQKLVRRVRRASAWAVSEKKDE